MPAPTAAAPVPAPTPAPAPAPAAPGTAGAATTDRPVDFSSDVVVYDSQADVLTANGRVRMSSEGNYLAADQISWDRKTGKVVALGNVVVVNPQGDKLIGDRVDLTDELRQGTVDNLLYVMESGARLAARRGSRDANGVLTLEKAVYSPCPVTTECGRAKEPSWKISAARVVNDPVRHRIRFSGGRFEILGITLPLLPIFSISTGDRSQGMNGFLLPDVKVSRRNGFELALPYHWQIAPNRDLTVTPRVFTAVYPALEAQYRELNSLGAYQIGGFLTYGDRRVLATDPKDDGIRAYVEGNGKFQFDPLWSLTTSFRYATDKTLLLRYDISRDERLRSFTNLERIDTNSYVSIAAWAFQGLLVTDDNKMAPIALPAIDARWRLEDPAFGGVIQLQANSLAILRREGQDSQRAFVSAEWNKRMLTPLGQELLLTAFGRGDIYHTSDSASTATAIYRGEDGWHGRAIGALAADLKWPFVGPAFGGEQILSPRVQVVLTPAVPNLTIPNEDSRSVDLEDSNLFALNRFSGYDRWEDGSRVTYGLDWTLQRPNLAINTTIGQSYRLNRRDVIFPDGTGLSGQLSDIVGRTRIQFGRLIDVTHRYRLDKKTLGVRRNELDLTIGTDATYVRAGYIRLNRNISQSIEDLQDSEELQLAGRWQVRRHWSVYGSTVIDLTDKQEDPLSIADGFDPVRHRLGIEYEDDCLSIGFSWRKDYVQLYGQRQGSTFQFRVALKGLGR
ncbi:LPS-assembly protein LptD [Sphingomonas ginkgonis]|uniref:LPS-assembly protein LptD n=1 Tax=Sphingomonas ginkgonis TaxID=2315330 RepID=A0A3R9WUM8_9SPHN|nr:LPS-assembly protein LptD [Sphingomonas ginkgonis]